MEVLKLIDCAALVDAHLVKMRTKGYSDFMIACAHKDSMLPVIEQFLQDGEDVNAVHGNLTPLMMAIGTESVETVKMLLDHGADPNLKVGDDQETPLWHASASRQFSFLSFTITKLLLKAGADPTHRVKDTSVLTQAVVIGNKFFVKAVLATKKKKLDLNAVDEKGNTALDFAILCNSRSIAQMLVDAGATRHKMVGHRLIKKLNFSVK